MQLTRTVDPNHVPPLRRGPLSERTKVPPTSWSIRTGVAIRLVVAVVLVATIVWAGSL